MFRTCSWRPAAFIERTRCVIGRGLLRRLATLGALAKRRQRRHHASLEPNPSAVATGKPRAPDEAAIRREEETSLRDAIAALPAREGAAFALRYFENLELPEIAIRLGISYSAAGAALSRARAKLTRLFSESRKKNDGYRKIKARQPAALGRAQPEDCVKPFGGFAASRAGRIGRVMPWRQCSGRRRFDVCRQGPGCRRRWNMP